MNFSPSLFHEPNRFDWVSTIRKFNNIFFIFIFQDWYYRAFGFPEQILRGELALVTGGGGGLGRLLALRLAKLGVDIVIWDINQEGEFSGRTHNNKIDFTEAVAIILSTRTIKYHEHVIFGEYAQSANII